QFTNSPMHQSPRLRSLQKFWHLRAFAKLHIGLLPVRAASGVAALALHLAVRDARADALDLRADQLFDGALDLRLVRGGRHVEHDRPPVLAEDRRFLGDERPADDVGELQHYASASCSFSIAPLVATTRDASMTARAVTRALGTSDTPGMLRTDFDSFSSTATSMSTALPVTPSRASNSAAAFVLIASAASASTTTSAPFCALSASAARSAPRSTFFGSRKS